MSKDASDRNQDHRAEAADPGIDYLGTLRRHWKACVVVPAIAAVATFVFAALAMTRTYTATAVVASAGLRYGSQETNLQQMPEAALAVFFREGKIGDEIVKRFQLADKYGYKELNAFASITVPRNTGTVRISVTLPSAELARDVANELADRGRTEFVGQMRKQHEGMAANIKTEAKQTQAAYQKAEKALEEFNRTEGPVVLAAQVSQWRTLLAARELKVIKLEAEVSVLDSRIAMYAQEWEKIAGKIASRAPTLAKDPFLQQDAADLDRIESRLVEFRKDNQPQALQDRIEILRDIRSTYLSGQAAVKTRLAGARAKQRKLRAELAGEPPMVKLDRRLVDSPALQQTAAKLSKTPQQELMDLDLSVSALNPTHTEIKRALVASQAEESKLVSELHELTEAAKQNEDLLKELTDELNRKTFQLDRLKLEHDVVSKYFTRLLDSARASRLNINTLRLEALRETMADRKKKMILEAELATRQLLLEGAKTKLGALETRLFEAERKLSEMTFDRDKARSTAGGVAGALQEWRNVPMWSPQTLYVLPAAIPTSPAGPRKMRMAGITLVVSFLVVYAVVGWLDGRVGKRRLAAETED